VPTYQYACTTCDHRFEAVQKFTDNSLTTCPECSGMLRKVYGSIGVVFKGSGFYRNDARGTGADNGHSDNGHSDAGHSDNGKEPVKATGGTSDPGTKSAHGTSSETSTSASSGNKESGSGSSSTGSSNGSTSSSSSSGSAAGSGGNPSSKPAAKAAKR